MLVPPASFWIWPAPTGLPIDWTAAKTESSNAARPAGVRTSTSAGAAFAASPGAASAAFAAAFAGLLALGALAFAAAFGALLAFALPFFGAAAALRAAGLAAGAPPPVSSPMVIDATTPPN